VVNPKALKRKAGMSLRMATSMLRKVRKSKQEFTIAGKQKDALDIRNHFTQHVRLLSNERSSSRPTSPPLLSLSLTHTPAVAKGESVWGPRS